MTKSDGADLIWMDKRMFCWKFAKFKGLMLVGEWGDFGC